MPPRRGRGPVGSRCRAVPLEWGTSPHRASPPQGRHRRPAASSPPPRAVRVPVPQRGAPRFRAGRGAGPPAESVSLGHEALPGNHMGEAAAPRAAQCAAAAGGGRGGGGGRTAALPGGTARLGPVRCGTARLGSEMAAPDTGSTGQCRRSGARAAGIAGERSCGDAERHRYPHRECGGGVQPSRERAVPRSKRRTGSGAAPGGSPDTGTGAR